MTAANMSGGPCEVRARPLSQGANSITSGEPALASEQRASRAPKLEGRAVARASCCSPDRLGRLESKRKLDGDLRKCSSSKLEHLRVRARIRSASSFV